MWGRTLKISIGILAAILLAGPNLERGLVAASTQLGIFYRCYGHLTGQRPQLGNPILRRVKDGQISGADGCIELLEKAEFNSEGEMKDSSDKEAVAVLQTINNFHRQWFDLSSLEDRPVTYTGGEEKIIDPTEPALFITRALFQPETPYRSIITGSSSLRAVRSFGAYYNGGDEPKKLSNAMAGTHRGSLTGIMDLSNSNSTWWNLAGATVTSIPYKSVSTSILRSYGAGVLGSQSYIMVNSGFMVRNEVSNGGIKVPRRWAKNIFQDLLCRELPVLRPSDVSETVLKYLKLEETRKTPSRIPFRESTSCMSCHATMDPMAATIRAATFSSTAEWDANGNGAHDTGDGTTFVKFKPSTLSAETMDTNLLPADAKFSDRPGNGALRYRSYDGTLHNIELKSANEFEGLQKLGDALAESKDFYACAAKRYLKFFTNIDVSLADLGHPDESPLSQEEELQRATLIKWANSFSQHQNLKILIHDILSSDLFQNMGDR